MKRKLFLTCLILIAIVVSCAFMACDGCSSCGDNDTAGGDSSYVPSYQWNGLKDFNLKISATDYDYSEVTVTSFDGLMYDVVVDDSQVVYGTKGVYDIKFTFGEETKIQKVRIYDIPTIAIESFSTVLSYEQVVDRSNMNGLFSHVIAKDCFDNDIAIGVEESSSLDSLYNLDGSVDYGVHTINLVAVDAAGQIAREQISFTIEENDETKPVFLTNSLILDVVDEIKTLSIDLRTRELMAVNLNGNVLADDMLTFNDAGLTLNLDEIDFLEIGDSNFIKLITSGGHSQIPITVVDNEDAQLDYGNSKSFFAFIGDEVKIPEPTKLNDKQSFEIVKTLKSPTLVEIDVSSSKTFTAQETGIYTLDIEAKRNGVLCGGYSIEYNVKSREYEFLNFKTEDSLKDFYLWNEYTVRSLETNVVHGGRLDNWVKIENNGSNWSGGITVVFPMTLTKAELQAKLDAGYNKITIPVYLSGATAPKTFGYYYGAEGAKEIAKNESLTYIVRDVKSIIDNYDDLKKTASERGTNPQDPSKDSKSMLIFYNYDVTSGRGRETGDFNLYIGSINFIKLQYEGIRDNEYMSFHDQTAINELYFWDEYTTKTLELDTTYGGRTDDWVNVLNDGSNWSNGITVVFPVLLSKAELQAKLDSGYTKIKIPIYMYGATAPKTFGYYYTAESETQVVQNETLTYLERSLEEIIENYDLLVAAQSNKNNDISPALIVFYNFNGEYGSGRETGEFNLCIGTIEFYN